jgi:hypothetical protein
MTSTGHFPATRGAVSTCLDTVIHAADLLAVCRACLANFSADLTKTVLKMRAAELKIGRCLADLGAAHHETEVFRFDMFSAGL